MCVRELACALLILRSISNFISSGNLDGWIALLSETTKEKALSHRRASDYGFSFGQCQTMLKPHNRHRQCFNLPGAVTFSYSVLFLWMMMLNSVHAQETHYRSHYEFAKVHNNERTHRCACIVGQSATVACRRNNRNIFLFFYHLIHKNRNYAISKPFTRHKFCHPFMQQHNGLVYNAITDDTRHDSPTPCIDSTSQQNVHPMLIIKFVACIQ